MSTTTFAVITLVAFVAMEPLTAATHRWVMHGVGSRLHRSHHRSTTGTRWEDNDAYPIAFASLVMTGFWFGFHRDSLVWLIPLGVGITMYGATYALVHDGYIHRRVAIFGASRHPVLDRLAEAHRIHHLYSGAPFGMLVPIVPQRLRSRAEHTTRDPLRRPPAAVS